MYRSFYIEFSMQTLLFNKIERIWYGSILLEHTKRRDYTMKGSFLPNVEAEYRVLKCTLLLVSVLSKPTKTTRTILDATPCIQNTGRQDTDTMRLLVFFHESLESCDYIKVNVHV
jgi:hypothetical protein